MVTSPTRNKTWDVLVKSFWNILLVVKVYCLKIRFQKPEFIDSADNLVEASLWFAYLTSPEKRPLLSRKMKNMKIYMDVRHVNAVHSFYLGETRKYTLEHKWIMEI